MATISGKYIQQRFGTPNVPSAYSRPSAGQSGTTGLYGQLGALPGYNPAPYQYQKVVDQPGLEGEALAAWRASQFAGQERQAALRRNLARQGATLAGYDTRIGNARRMADVMAGQYEGFGESQRRRLGQEEAAGLARANQSAVRRGLGNTTIRNALAGGVRRQYGDQRLGLEDALIQNRINLNSQALGRENDLTGQRLNYLTGIQDYGPSLDQVMGYSLAPTQIQQSRADAERSRKDAVDREVQNSLFGLASLGLGKFGGGSSGGGNYGGGSYGGGGIY